MGVIIAMDYYDVLSFGKATVNACSQVILNVCGNCFSSWKEIVLLSKTVTIIFAWKVPWYLYFVYVEQHFGLGVLCLMNGKTILKKKKRPSLCILRQFLYWQLDSRFCAGPIESHVVNTFAASAFLSSRSGPRERTLRCWVKVRGRRIPETVSYTSILFLNIWGLWKSTCTCCRGRKRAS